MPETVGIQQTKELMVALGDLSAVVAKAVKAGGQASEIGSRIAADLVTSPTLVAEIKAAADGISEIPAEIKDLSIGESLELLQVSLATTQKALAALK
jgi:hypothetical protein